MITISRGMIGPGQTLHLAESWISNGHWAVHRGVVSNAALCTPEAAGAAFKIDDPRELKDAQVDGLIAKALADAQEWTVTAWMCRGPTYGALARNKAKVYRLLVDVTTGQPVFCDTSYLEALGFVEEDRLYGPASGPLVDARETPTRIMMPLVTTGTEPTLDTLVAVAAYVTQLPVEAPKVMEPDDDEPEPVRHVGIQIPQAGVRTS